MNLLKQEQGHLTKRSPNPEKSRDFLALGIPLKTSKYLCIPFNWPQ